MNKAHICVRSIYTTCSILEQLLSWGLENLEVPVEYAIVLFRALLLGLD